MTIEHVLAVVVVADLDGHLRLAGLTDPDGNRIAVIGGFRVRY